MNQRTAVKQNSLNIALVSVFALVATAVSAGTSAANNAGATFAVTVVVPIAIAKAADFNFGSFYSGSTPGTVHADADADGKRSVSGGVLTADSGPTPTAAKFDVIGGASTTYTIYCPSGVTVTGPGAPMALTRIGDLVGADATTTGAGRPDASSDPRGI